jgi:hypothetical protein
MQSYGKQPASRRRTELHYYRERQNRIEETMNWAHRIGA